MNEGRLAAMTEATVLVRDDGPVRTLTFNRPARLNAWTFEMGDHYFDLLDEAERDPEVRVVVVTGAGRGFCSGMDADSLAVSAGGVKRVPAKGRQMTHAVTIAKPVIAAINGPCAGLGLVQALACDIRFMAASAVVTTSFTRRGLNAEYGASWLLPRIVGQTRAAELLLSGRRVDAAEAERIGLVNWVFPEAELPSRVAEYARDVAGNCSPVAMADTKRQLFGDWRRTLEESLRYAKLIGHQPGHRQDFAEGVASLRERRPPRFEGLDPALLGRDARLPADVSEDQET
jgi:enoyl-CoA hydratase/carnithine racemase